MLEALVQPWSFTGVEVNHFCELLSNRMAAMLLLHLPSKPEEEAGAIQQSRQVHEHVSTQEFTRSENIRTVVN
jgi:hypothetical protein